MRITRLEFPTNDLPTMQSFYARHLCLPLLSSTDRLATFQVGWTKLVVRQTDTPTTPGHFALNVPLYTLEQYQLWFEVPYLDTGSPGQRIANFPNWKARASYFRDPDGNVVEFIERRDAGFAESGGDYFQGISEVGIATSNVAATTARLNHDYGLRQFTKCSPQADFNAVGDDYGLLILARTGRPWLFTNVPATMGDWKVQVCNQHHELVEIEADLPLSRQQSAPAWAYDLPGSKHPKQSTKAHSSAFSFLAIDAVV